MGVIILGCKAFKIPLYQSPSKISQYKTDLVLGRVWLQLFCYSPRDLPQPDSLLAGWGPGQLQLRSQSKFEKRKQKKFTDSERMQWPKIMYTCIFCRKQINLFQQKYDGQFCKQRQRLGPVQSASQPQLSVAQARTRRGSQSQRRCFSPRTCWPLPPHQFAPCSSSSPQGLSQFPSESSWCNTSWPICSSIYFFCAVAECAGAAGLLSNKGTCACAQRCKD